jgi:hypothetical protein
MKGMINEQCCKLATSAALMAVVLCLAGCTLPPKQPIFQDTSFNPVDVDQIVVLPAVDLRPDKSVDMDVTKSVAEAAESTLRSRKYKCAVAKDAKPPDVVSEDDLKKPRSEWVQSLGPSGARWIMAAAVHDLTKKITFGASANAEVSTYLYDKQSGKCVWHDKGVGQAGQGGLLGMLDPVASMALQGATMNAVMGLPQRPKPGK